jgi:hypothetical protein
MGWVRRAMHPDSPLSCAGPEVPRNPILAASQSFPADLRIQPGSAAQRFLPEARGLANVGMAMS